MQSILSFDSGSIIESSSLRHYADNKSLTSRYSDDQMSLMSKMDGMVSAEEYDG